MTILFGVFARLLFALAAGLGINSFLATTVVGTPAGRRRWARVINGVIIMLLATGLRRLVRRGCPCSSNSRSPRASDRSSFHRAGRRRLHLFDRAALATGSAGHRRQRLHHHDPHPVFVGTLLLTGVLVVRRVRGGILLGCWRAPSSRSRSRRSGISAPRSTTPAAWSLSVPTLSGSPVRPARPGPGRRRQLHQLRPHRRARGDHAGVHPGVRQLLRRDGYLHRVVPARPDRRSAGDVPRLRTALIVEGAGAVVGGSTSASSNTVFIESGGGHRGGRAPAWRTW